MRPMREKIQTKLNSMSSILMDNIINPKEVKQRGLEKITSSFYDKDGNQFSFTLILKVTPEEKEEQDYAIDDMYDEVLNLCEEEEEVTPVTTEEALNIALSKIDTLESAISSIKEDIDVLKEYHKTPEVSEG